MNPCEVGPPLGPLGGDVGPPPGGGVGPLLGPHCKEASNVMTNLWKM